MDDSTPLFGRKTKKHWLDIKEKIEQDSNEVTDWTSAIDLLEARLETRYFQPIRKILDSSKAKNDDGTVMALSGEGFAAMTLICSLIEFLQSCYEGKEYKLRAAEADFVYGYSGEKFKSFLLQHKPFKAIFSQSVSVPVIGPPRIDNFADDFYSNVRCGLLHEAATKDNWKIKVGDRDYNPENFVDISNEASKIIYRNNFFGAIKSYFEDYKKKIIEDKEETFNDGRGNRNLNLRNGFCRKLDLLCNTPDSERIEKWWQ